MFLTMIDRTATAVGRPRLEGCAGRLMLLELDELPVHQTPHLVRPRDGGPSERVRPLLVQRVPRGPLLRVALGLYPTGA